MERPASLTDFDELGYLAANPDVAAAVRRGEFASGRQHFEAFGIREGRQQSARNSEAFAARKRAKRERILPLLRVLAKVILTLPAGDCLDFLTPELRARYAIIDTDAVSANAYDENTLALIDRHAGGMVLDCGAGHRSIYLENVINFEIAAYDTTDVRGVGEELPFSDESLDAVLSLAVLEHVKDPFACAREITRVLKPGGELMVCVPLLQPVHAYPHHYYNMTAQGLANLFPGIRVDRQEVCPSMLPIWSLTWIIRSWADGLKDRARSEFLNLRMADLLESGESYLNRSFVRDLGDGKNFELASATVLFGHKP
jgi:SAM-dependent methyltransferase